MCFGLYLAFSALSRIVYLTLYPNYDEWYYLACWNAIKNGEALYRTILDNKPPLAYFLYAVPDNISLFATQTILSTIVAFFTALIARHYAAGMFFLMITATLPSFLELNLEYWVLGCILPAYYYLFEKKSIWGYRFAYFLCGAALMIKQHSLLLVLPLVLYNLWTDPRHFWRNAYFALILPLFCLFYLVYCSTTHLVYDWLIGYNLWYKNLSETGKYIWKRFIYGQFFLLPLYVGLGLVILSIKSNIRHLILLLAFVLSLSSVWIGKELYLHYQILIIPFLILLFFELAPQKKIKSIMAGVAVFFLLSQATYFYTYLTGTNTWMKKLEGVLSYQEQKQIPILAKGRVLVFSAESHIGLDYRQVKHIAVCSCLEYLNRNNPHSARQLLSCDLYLKNAIYVVPKSCLKRYVGSLGYRIVFEYQDNVGIEIDHCA
ncbi:MAG: hypothetical protein RML38_05000 [Bacteroidia bacterium]|nr:hypothetical protein [Bacteroidia bacterium]